MLSEITIYLKMVENNQVVHLMQLMSNFRMSDEEKKWLQE